MNEYKSIEEMFPDWKEARQVIEAQIPERLKFIQSRILSSSVELDFTFTDNILSSYCSKVSDYSDKDILIKTFVDKLDFIGCEAINHILIKNGFFETTRLFEYRRITIHLLATLTDLLRDYDVVKKHTNKATTIDIVKHCFGVQPCYLDFN